MRETSRLGRSGCHSLLQRQLVALLQCRPVGHGFGGLVQQLQDQSPEPLVWTVEGDSDRAVNRIESNRSFLLNRPSLASSRPLYAAAAVIEDQRPQRETAIAAVYNSSPVNKTESWQRRSSMRFPVPPCPVSSIQFDGDR